MWFIFPQFEGLKKRNELVKAALNWIAGIDVHPVAALMAKANTLLALASELPRYFGGYLS